jgi:hypothetical protein
MSFQSVVIFCFIIGFFSVVVKTLEPPKVPK